MKPTRGVGAPARETKTLLIVTYASGNITDSARIGGRISASLRSVTGFAVTNP